MNTVIDICNVSKKYRGKDIIKKVNIKVKTGEIYGLIGENGVGKTSLLKIIVGLIDNSDGTIRLFDSDNKNAGRKKIGSLIEEPCLYENLTGRQNLEMQYMLIKSKGFFTIEKVLEIMNLEENSNRKVRVYSLGMKKRLGLAMALLGNPKLLILDEPLNGLDPIAIVQMRKLIIMLSRNYNISVIIASHIIDELLKVSDRCGVISRGEIIKEFSVNEIKTNENYDEIETEIIEIMEKSKNV